MTSILTNQSSMTALQTLKGINKSLNTVQGEVSSGLKIANAKDNASVWAIAATMRSDVASFKQINDGLGTALAAVNVGRNATETVSDLLTQMRAKIVSATTLSTDPDKTQLDVDALINQINAVVNAASFNGVNFVSNDATSRVLISADRTSGVVETTPEFLDIVGVNLTESGAGTARAAFATAVNAAHTATDGDLTTFSMNATGANIEQVTIDAGTMEEGDRFEVTIGSRTATYVVTQADLDAPTPSEVIAGKVRAAIEGLNITGVTIDVAGAVLDFNNDGTDAVDQNVLMRLVPVDGGLLTGLGAITVGDAATNTTALAVVDALLDNVTGAAAELGSTQKRLEIQQEFISKLADSLTIGIGALVDADMEEASARLAALQTQQQLGIQSLSIANQSPQSIMALFR